MIRARARRLVAGILLLSGAALLTAQDVPLANWTVPTYQSAGGSGGLTTMSDVTPGVGFVGIQPCRVADTRGNGAPIQGGIFPNSGLRTWDLTGLCGLPAGTDAISANFTVVAAGGIPQGSFLLAWPTGQPAPPTAIMTYGPGQIISNAAIVPLGPGEQINVNVSGSTHIVMDVNGYFSDQYNPGVSFHAASASAGDAIFGENTYGVFGGNGVHGKSTNGYGVYGESVNNNGVVASSAAGGNAAVWARNTSSVNGSTGVFGWANSSTGIGNIFGGKFVTDSTYSGSAGVKGISGYGTPFGDSVGSYGSSGVVGLDSSGVSGPLGNGVLGISRGSAVAGLLFGAQAFDTEAEGYLGYRQGAAKYGVLSKGGTLGTGIKSFADPHPTDASKIIRYVSLEGPEAGTYFRGKSRFQRGLAVIEVPKDFRMVSDPEGLTIQVTPIGQMATVAVVRIDLDRIVVRGSRDVEFFYLVNGERATFKGIEPITEEQIFMPASAGSSMPAYLSEQQKRLLIQNGTYGDDGRVNMETARRLGWDKVWEKRNRPVAYSSQGQ